MPQPEQKMLNAEWTARSERPKRSVFGNYRPAEPRPPDSATSRSDGERENHLPSRRGQETVQVEGDAASRRLPSLQQSIDLAVARSFIHRYLAKAFEDPTPEGWDWLCAAATRESLRAAWDVAAFILPAVESGFQPGGENVASTETLEKFEAAINSSANPGGKMPPSTAGRMPAATFSPDAFDSFHSACLAAFGHAARGLCPLNEIEYGDLKADPLFQPHRLADLGAFYRAFGLEVADDADERHDHICMELEFMSVLAMKEAYALEHQLDVAQLTQCRDAQRKFLREHLGRWAPAFARRLAATTDEPSLRALAGFTRGFIETECARSGVKPGSEDLLLRPVDEAADRMCDSCGIAGLPPGALG